MKKRFISALIAGAMAVTLFTGCGDSGNVSEAGTGNNGSSSEAEAENSGSASGTEGEEPVKIVMEMLYFAAVPRDLELVEDAINAISIPEIGVEVEFYPLSPAEATTQISLMISSKEQLDLIVPFGQSDFLSLVNKNMLLELDDLYAEYGSNIEKNAGITIAGGYVGENLYGIPSIERLGRTNGFLQKRK